MINRMTISALALTDPFIGYQSYLPKLSNNELSWLSTAEQARVMRYGLLLALYHNFAIDYMSGKVPTFGDKIPIETKREYGDASLICDTIRDATIAGEVNLSDFVPNELWEVWNKSNINKQITDQELISGILGDGFYHQYQRQVNDWRLEKVDPRFSVVQAYDREIRHIVFWSAEQAGDNTFVTSLEYVLVETNTGYECYWRQVQWRLKKNEELKKEDRVAQFPFNYKVLTQPRDLLAEKGLDPEGSDVLSPVFYPEELVGSGTAPFYPFRTSSGAIADFLPVVHIANIDSGGVYGLSDLHGSLQTLLDMPETNGHLRDAEDLLGVPPVAVEDAGSGFSDLKSGFKVGNQEDTTTKVRLQPGMLLNGKVYLVDVSRLLTALLEGKKHKQENIYSVSHVPEVAASPSSLRVVSGEALKVMFRPLVLLSERKRIDRRAKFTTMMQNFAKLTGTSLQLTREQPTVITFGDIEQWLSNRFADSIMLAQTQKVISSMEARAHLVRGGTLDKGTLDPNYVPPENGSTLSFEQSTGQAPASNQPNEEGEQ